MNKTQQQIEVDGVTAGRDAIVNLTQILQGSSDSATKEWAEAILRGPLQVAGLEADAKRASELEAAGDLLGAAEATERIAESLTQQDFAQVGNIYLEHAAGLYAREGKRDRAADLYVTLVSEGIRRFDRYVTATARRAADLLEDRWLAAGLLARAGWVERGGDAVAPVRDAWLKMKDGPSELEWAAALVELQAIVGMEDEAVAVAREVRSRHPLAPGPRLQLELDYLAALEDVAGPGAADAAWGDVLAWADDLGARDPADTGWVMQRRGAILATRDDLDLARAAYLKAIQAWSRCSGRDADIAESFFSLDRARLLSGLPSEDHPGLRALAADMRAARPDSLIAHAERLETAGANYLLQEKYPDSREALWLAFSAHRRAGNLSAVLAVTELLAQLHQRAGEKGVAIALWVASGHGKEAAELAADVSPTGVRELLSLDGPMWERAASVQVVAAMGRRLPEDDLAALAPVIFELAAEMPRSMLAPHPGPWARRAIAAMVCGLRGDLLQRALVLLRDEVRSNDLMTAREAATALVQVTTAGLSDETALVLEATLSRDLSFLRLSPAVVADMIDEDADARQRVREAAEDGNNDALEIAAMLDMPRGDARLSERCIETVRARTKDPVLEVDEEGRQVSLGFGVHAEEIGLLARFADDETRTRAVAWLMDILSDSRQPEMNRGSAANAFYNLGPALGPLRAEVVAGLLPLASGAYERSEVDRESAASLHPFSRFRFDWSAPHYLQASALQALARLADSDPDLTPRVETLVESALRTGAPPLVSAGLEALGWLRGSLPDLDLVAWLTYPDEGVQRAALRAWASRCDEIPPDSALHALLASDSMGVKLALLGFPQDDAASVRAKIIEPLARDADAYIRTIAANRLTLAT